MKMKVRHIILICILSILMVVFGFVGGCFISGKCNYKYKNTNEYLNKWMSLIKDDTKLNNIIIPGSHDSGSYKMLYMGETQRFDISKQLQLGARYFDIRITNDEGTYRIFHDIIKGVEAEPIFGYFRDFLNDNPSETLILDFQHFENDSEEKVLEFINTYLSDKVLKNNTSLSDLAFIDGLTLADVRGKCIILFRYSAGYSDLDYIFSRNNDACALKNTCLNSKYVRDYNTKGSVLYLNDYIQKYIDDIKDKVNDEGYKGLFVLQAQLTDAKKIFGPWSREKNHDANMQSWISSLNNHPDFAYINIIMRDFLNQEKCENIIRMNYYKYIVKDEYDELYMNTFKVA